MELTTYSPEETFSYGQKIGTYIVSIPTDREALLLCFYGDLGSGKTTFTAGLANGLGVRSFIPSPTYIIVRHYPIKQKAFENFYHVDLYRVPKNEEIGTLGLTDFFSDPKNIIAVEWAEKLEKNLPEKRLDIKLTVLDEYSRKIEVNYSKAVEEAIKILNQGGIVIFPTDTAFGIGCRIDNEKAIKRLFKIRKRPETKAVPVLVSSPEMASHYFLPYSNIVRQFMKEFWPGQVTVVYKCNTKVVSPLVRGGNENIGLRIPNHPVALKLIEGIGTGLLAPSANFHNSKTPYSFDQLDSDLIKLVDYIVPGECTIKEASTVVDCSKIPFNIIRRGANYEKVINFIH